VALTVVIAASPFAVAILLALLGKALSGFLVDLVLIDRRRPDQARLESMLEVQAWMSGFVFLALGILVLPDTFDVDLPAWYLVGFAVMFVLIVLVSLAARPSRTATSTERRRKWSVARFGTALFVLVNLLAIAGCLVIARGWWGTRRDVKILPVSNILFDVKATPSSGGDSSAQKWDISGKLRGPYTQLAGRIPWAASVLRSSGQGLSALPIWAVNHVPCRLLGSAGFECDAVPIGEPDESGIFNTWVFLASPDEIRSIILQDQSIALSPNDTIAVPIKRTARRATPARDVTPGRAKISVAPVEATGCSILYHISGEIQVLPNPRRTLWLVALLESTPPLYYPKAVMDSKAGSFELDLPANTQPGTRRGRYLIVSADDPGSSELQLSKDADDRHDDQAYPDGKRVRLPKGVVEIAGTNELVQTC
jgi:hypothetical protein